MGVELEYFFFNCLLGNQSVNRYGAGLPDAVGAVTRLVFDGGIPPRVGVNYVVSSRQIQACATCF